LRSYHDKKRGWLTTVKFQSKNESSLISEDFEQSRRFEHDKQELAHIKPNSKLNQFEKWPELGHLASPTKQPDHELGLFLILQCTHFRTVSPLM
jgi:hypothetical protein